MDATSPPDPEDHRQLNRSNWASRVGHHTASSEYGVERYVSDPAHLSDVVRFDLPRLGDIAGLDVVHLQCHIGTDTLSLARLGAPTSYVDHARLVQLRLPGHERRARRRARRRILAMSEPRSLTDVG